MLKKWDSQFQEGPRHLAMLSSFSMDPGGPSPNPPRPAEGLEQKQKHWDLCPKYLQTWAVPRYTGPNTQDIPAGKKHMHIPRQHYDSISGSPWFTNVHGHFSVKLSERCLLFWSEVCNLVVAVWRNQIGNLLRNFWAKHKQCLKSPPQGSKIILVRCFNPIWQKLIPGNPWKKMSQDCMHSPAFLHVQRQSGLPNGGLTTPRQ